MPSGKITFVKESEDGTAPKFEVVDERGVHWKAKLGEEAQPETAATRLVWAAGFYTDDDYYYPQLRIEGLRKLKRGRNFVSPDGTVRGVRLERKFDGPHGESWSWYHNPFTGTRELNGLRVMMALINNWDLKQDNTGIYNQVNGPPHFAVSDLGATFGRTGNTFTRSKSNLAEYRQSRFIQHTHSESVDFYLSSRPFLLTIFHLPNYITRTHMQSIVKNIPREHAKWLGQTLARLSPEQIRDCFRAAGYSPEEVEGFSQVVQIRIADLNRL